MLISAVLSLPAPCSLHAQEDPRPEPSETLIFTGPNEAPLSAAEAFLWNHSKSTDGNAGGVDVINQARISELRCLQLEYFGDEGGTVVCTWSLVNRFKRILVRIDNVFRGELPGNATGTNLEVIPPGEHKIRVEGILEDRTQVVETTITVFPAPPIVVEAINWRASGFSFDENSGRMRVWWNVSNPLNLAIESFNICVYLNGSDECQRFEETACNPNAEPDGACVVRSSLSIGSLPPGCFRFEIQAFSKNYASKLASLCTFGRPVEGPIDATCSAVSCSEGRINAIGLNYTVPDFFEYDAVAVWTLQNGNVDFVGYADPFADNVNLRSVNLAIEPFEVELAGARFLDHTEICPELQVAVLPGDPGDVGAIDFGIMCPNVVAAQDGAPVPGEDPNNPDVAAQLRMFGNFPGSSGPHTVIACEPVAGQFGCPPPVERRFRRGDVDVNTEVDIVDVMKLLFFMFGHMGNLRCHDAADIDNNGLIVINDPILLLSALFRGTNTIRAPGPLTCGFDAIADLANADDDSLPSCRYPDATCDIVGPVDPVGVDADQDAAGD